MASEAPVIDRHGLEVGVYDRDDVIHHFANRTRALVYLSVWSTNEPSLTVLREMASNAHSRPAPKCPQHTLVAETFPLAL